MKKRFGKYHEYSNEEKMDEKTFLVRISAPIIAIFVCILSIGFTAYAYFSYDIASQGNDVQAASYDLDVSVMPPEQAISTVADTDRDTYSVTPVETSIYTFTLKTTENTTASTGYCKIIIKVNDEVKMVYTRQIAKGDSLTVNVLNIPAGATVEFTFTPEWGTYAGATTFSRRGMMEIDIASLFEIEAVDEVTTEEPGDGTNTEDSTETEGGSSTESEGTTEGNAVIEGTTGNPTEESPGTEDTIGGGTEESPGTGDTMGGATEESPGAGGTTGDATEESTGAEGTTNENTGSGGT